MSKLLINEAPLQVIPSLAKALGDVSEAIVLQQIHYWLNIPQIGKSHKGRRWVRNSVKQWQKENFCMWSERTIMRILHKLEEGGFIMSVDTLNNFSYDRTKWYTINYEKLSELEKQIEVEKLAEAEKEKAKRRKFSAEPQETDLPCDTLTPPDNLSPRTPDNLSPRTPDNLSVTIYRDSLQDSLTESKEAQAQKTPPPPVVETVFEREETDQQKAAVAQMNGITPKAPLTVALQKITLGVSIGKLLAAAYQLHQLGATPEDLIGFPEWGAKNNLKGLIYPSQVVANWLKYKPAAGVKVDLREALKQLRGIAHLQNGRFSAAWGQLPQEVKEVLSSEAKKNGCRAVDLLGLELA